MDRRSKRTEPHMKRPSELGFAQHHGVLSRSNSFRLSKPGRNVNSHRQVIAMTLLSDSSWLLLVDLAICYRSGAQLRYSDISGSLE